MIFFLDTNFVIYRVEKAPGFGARATNELTAQLNAGHPLVDSELVRMECRVQPMGNGDAETLGMYDTFLASVVGSVLPINTAVCERATVLRATYNFKPMDALQLAAAIVHGCDRFLTADARLSRCPDIAIDLLP